MAGIELRGGGEEAKVGRQKYHMLGSADLTLIEQEMSGNINPVIIRNLYVPSNVQGLMGKGTIRYYHLTF